MGMQVRTNQKFRFKIPILTNIIESIEPTDTVYSTKLEVFRV